MFVPDRYRPQHPGQVLDLVRGNPLALLTVNGDTGPFATHLPMVPEESTLAAGGGPTGLAGTTFLGHMDRRNPQWAALTADRPALAVFHGPHGYVSPTVYGTVPAAPTWDFTAVHLRGRIERLAPEEVLGVVTETVRIFERDLGTGWDTAGSLDYFASLATGVGAFRLHVTAADAMLKLSQEKDDAVRARVACAFARSAEGGHRALAALMD
ncbi:FMN-binding negative transcriptional regulator [Streptomyces sp. V4-01]|uniref:FMN-binding negative transcriptional regulator n=1 Tax=Actinacidiphila polyblastidii TaxID=3110430 RepID=A0ABU7PI97_9ACTN|nr:FMN-binding negative transcriptional regulator [Streptomyces sp. V4-01]